MLIYFVCYRKPADTWIFPNKIILQFIRGGTLFNISFNPLNAELNPIRHLLALVGAHQIVHVSRIRVNTSFLPTVASDCTYATITCSDVN